MKIATILITALLVLFAAPVFAGEYTVESLYPDFGDGDTMLEPGGPLNPYYIYSEDGQEIGRIESTYPNLTDDPMLEPGTVLNPMRIITDD